ncbi:anion permease [Clostridium polyendosporum]|uniref:Probable membrane transporter protein n=1 Tax=Clostridium polyendosporum TaxID=69208 RepID=A0A919S4J3_9CLOT|nr:sulfite exporter TauE/SafE family protein [Clostridium polyendosporum]GIM30473.1 anion permease [Clostridium polyendosporum]
MQTITLFNLSVWQFIWIIIAAFVVGFSKTGISGFTMLVIPIIANVFGGKESTGVLLPMLLIGDIFAVCYYNRHADWNNIRKPLPWALVGLVLGSFVGNYINDKQFKILIAISVLTCLGILLYTEKKGDKFKVPKGAWFYILTGIASGFTSMIGNAAGPVLSIYLLAMGFKKNEFLGTYSWFFLIINLTKVPLQIFFWNNISLERIILACVMIPAITLGALLGIATIKKFNEKVFRTIIIVMTAIVAIRLFI